MISEMSGGLDPSRATRDSDEVRKQYTCGLSLSASNTSTVTESNGTSRPQGTGRCSSQNLSGTAHPN